HYPAFRRHELRLRRKSLERRGGRASVNHKHQRVLLIRGEIRWISHNTVVSEVLRLPRGDFSSSKREAGNLGVQIGQPLWRGGQRPHEVEFSGPHRITGNEGDRSVLADG